MTISLNLCLQTGCEKGRVELFHGTLAQLEILSGKGHVQGNDFAVSGREPRLRVRLTDAQVASGAGAACLTLWRDGQSVTFFVRDALHAECPVLVPDYGLAVTSGDGEERAFSDIAREVASRGLLSDRTRFASEPEESYASAAAKNRRPRCPTWLGVARDMRLFRVQPVGGCNGDSGCGYWGEIVAARHSVHRYQAKFAIGSGANCRYRITRWLEEGVLPILHSDQEEGDMVYHVTLFAALEMSPLDPSQATGTDIHTAYAHFGGNMLPEEERNRIREAYRPDGEVVLCCRVQAVNRGRVPGYAWFKAPELWAMECTFADGVKTRSEDDRVLLLARLDGTPAPQDEMAVLVQPGQTATYEFFMPHEPLPGDRAAALLDWDFDRVHQAVQTAWKEKLDLAARIEIPEKPVQDHVRAGLLHCDIVAVGEEPDGPVAPTIGWYGPIGTESAPIIQFFDSMGRHKLAERCLDFFIDRQREDGFIQNFGNYQSETGPWIGSMGEHWRYTRDLDWLRRTTPAIRKACDFLLAWRERNKTEACREAGCYGLVEGKVADPEDYTHQFYLNGGTWQGLQRAAEMLRHTEPDYARALEQEVRAYRQDIRRAFSRALGLSPVVPLPDGSWAPYPPPWTEGRGAPHLYAEPKSAFSHCTFAARTSMVGSLWLPYCEVLDPFDLESEILVKTNQRPTTRDNAALSQPYYSRHDFLHLARGEVASFLKTYYNQLTALADHETYTFWEHYYGASQHKTHEEGWFLMQTRWALYREDGDRLLLFSGIPRAWLAPGKRVKVEGVRSYFGALDFEAVASGDGNSITACVRGDPARAPNALHVRLPHPEHRRAVSVHGAERYEHAAETVVIDNFTGRADITLGFKK